MEWNTHKKLYVVSAVLRHGEQAWHTVSRLMRSTFKKNYFTPQICAQRYKDLLEEYEPLLTGDEPAVIALCRRLTYRHLGELRMKIIERRNKYFEAKNKLKLIHTLTPDEVWKSLEELYNICSEDSSDDLHPEEKYDSNVIIAANCLMCMTEQVELMLNDYSSDSSLSICDHCLSTSSDDSSEVSEEENQDASSAEEVDDTLDEFEPSNSSVVDDIHPTPSPNQYDLPDSSARSRDQSLQVVESCQKETNDNDKSASESAVKDKDKIMVIRLWKKIWTSPGAAPFTRPLPSFNLQNSLYGKLIKKANLPYTTVVMSGVVPWSTCSDPREIYSLQVAVFCVFAHKELRL
ncbi:hypothetical protein GJ496_001813 [Pomphorhynchus laevis]|nr:hypothetical protein GJ496_001813 [Pomphorhynchus laevis]